MKILLGADTYAPDVNGAARFSERLAAGLISRGHEVHVVAPSPSPSRPVGVEEVDGVPVYRMRSHAWPGHDTFRVCLPWQIRPDVASVVRAVQPDVIHTQAHFVVGRCLVRPARRHDIPFVATNHLMPENLLDQAPVPTFVRQFVAKAIWSDIRRVFRHADVVTAPTPAAVELLQGHSGLQGALPVSCGIDPVPYARAARAAAARRDPDDVPTVLFVGRLDPEKRVGELVDAFAALPDDVPARLEIVGDGTAASTWRDRARDLGLLAGGRVRFHGFLPEAELLAAYGRADVFVMPSIAELQSLVTLEAMSAGKPVVGADAMALPHLVHPGRNGFLYRPGDVAGLTAHLTTLLRDPALRARLGAESARIVTGHAVGATLDTFEDLYVRAGAAHGRALSRGLRERRAA